MNHDNEYLHYQDDWYIVDCAYDNNKDGTPPFAFVYYRGSNDAWDGYGGAVIYTRDASLPKSLMPRLREAAKKVGMDFDKDFTLTDNSCPAELTEEEKLIRRERFAGKVALQTERQLQAEATRLRGFAVNTIDEEKEFVSKEIKVAERVGKRLEDKLIAFEQEVVREAESLEKEVEKDVKLLEKEVEKDAMIVEQEVEKDVKKIFGR